MNSVRSDSSVWRSQTELSIAPQRAETFVNAKESQGTPPSPYARTAALRTFAIVDHEDKARFILKKILESSGAYCCVGSFASGEEAIHEIGRVRPEIVFVETRLPGMSGIEYMRRLKVILPGLTVVLVSRLKNLEIMAEALAAGGDGYLTKPFDIVQCFATLTVALRRAKVCGPRERAELSVPFTRDRPESLRLTNRENDVMRCFAKGLLYKETAVELGIRYSTVNKHQHNIFVKLGVSNRTEALNRWWEISRGTELQLC